MIAEYGLGNEVSILGDVYSYGVLLLEMFTGKRPTDSEFGEALGLHKYVQMALPNKVIDIADYQLLSKNMDGDVSTPNPDIRGDIRIACITSVLHIGVSCSKENPTDRMQIGDALKELLTIRDRFQMHLSSMQFSSN
jgi:serine/threonine protein kinase